MNTDSLELIFEKLGTTMENIVPSTIEYGKRTCTIDALIYWTVFSVGIFLIILGIIYAHKTDYEHDYETICIVCFTVGIGLALFGLGLGVTSSVNLYLWNSNHATIKAYETILGWIKG